MDRSGRGIVEMTSTMGILCGRHTESTVSILDTDESAERTRDH